MNHISYAAVFRLAVFFLGFLALREFKDFFGADFFTAFPGAADELATMFASAPPITPRWANGNSENTAISGMPTILSDAPDGSVAARTLVAAALSLPNHTRLSSHGSPPIAKRAETSSPPVPSTHQRDFL